MRIAMKITRLSRRYDNERSVDSGKCAKCTIRGGMLPCKIGCAISRACGKKESEKSRFPRIPFCEGLIPHVESPFLGFRKC